MQWQPTPVLLPWKSHGWRSLVGCSPGGSEESDTTERLHFHFSVSCIGEGNGNPLQCSCLENPRDGGAWWAAVYGVAQSRTRLKRLSSSSSLQSHCMGSLEKCTLAPDNSEQRVCLKLVTNEGQLYKWSHVCQISWSKTVYLYAHKTFILKKKNKKHYLHDPRILLFQHRLISLRWP